MKVLVFGQTGQVARELSAHGAVTTLSRREANLLYPEACAEAILSRKPACVINAAAYTQVDRAEEEEQAATTINAHSPEAMARACAHLDIPFVTLSTDYVFDGKGQRPWREEDPGAPVNAYGRSKYLGEQAVLGSGARALVVRTSWIFSPHSSNFVKSLLRAGEAKDGYSIIDDQVGGPTPAKSIAAALLSMVSQPLGLTEQGIYHFSGLPSVSWFEFAQTIFRFAGQDPVLSRISAADYPSTTQRPANSRLDCSKIRDVFNIQQPDWRINLREVVKECLKS